MRGRAAIAKVSGIALVLTLACATTAVAQLTLYATAKGEVEGFAPSTLFTLGIADAVAVAIGPIEGPDPSEPGTLHWQNVTGLAFLPDGRLLGAASADAILVAGSGSALIEIDRQTGDATFIGVIVDDDSGVCGRITDLAYESVSGILYGIGSRCTDDEDRLYSIDPESGEGTERGVIDELKRKGNGLAVEPATSVLFATRSRIQTADGEPDRLFLDLQTLDPETGDGTSVNQSNSGNFGGIDFHPLDGQLYAVGLEEEEIDPDTLVNVPALGTIDTANARFTRIGITSLDGETLFGVEAIAFRPPGGCPLVPTEGCFGPRKSKLSITASSGKLKWKWSRGSFDKEILGDPTLDTDYRICIYDTAAPDPEVPGDASGPPLLAAGAEAPAGEGWKSKKKGFRYKSKDGTPDGLTSLRLKAGASNAKLSVKGKDVTAPALPFGQSPSVLVEVQNVSGECWQAIYGSPAKKNDENRFEEKFK